MTSCEEAEFFLANCPGVKMDHQQPVAASFLAIV